jgi:hypothetical protein
MLLQSSGRRAVVIVVALGASLLLGSSVLAGPPRHWRGGEVVIVKPSHKRFHHRARCYPRFRHSHAWCAPRVIVVRPHRRVCWR